MRLIEKVWFKKHKAKYLLVPVLLPLSLLFFLLISVRRLAFKCGWLSSYKLPKPVIVVGNIGVGGNGKTPVVVHVVELIQQLGLTPGVISRGYGGNAPNYPYVVTEQSSARMAGDEPILIYRRCKVPVAIGRDRIATAKRLIEQGCDVIISDDGLQHYRLQRDLELVLVDAKRLFGNGLLLPAGPLREGQWRLKNCDMLIYNGQNNDTQRLLTQAKAIHPMCEVLAMDLIAVQVCHLLTGTSIPVAEFLAKHTRVNAIAGIGDPERFFTSLTKLNFVIDKRQGFVDHHGFTLEDLQNYDDNIPLLMTEKDAVKCQAFAREHWWYLPVSAHFGADEISQLQAKIHNCILASK